MLTLDRIEALAKRLEKARQMVMAGMVEQLTDTEFAVDSERDPHKFYLVNGKCTCEDYKWNGEELGFCKHILAVELYKKGATHAKAKRTRRPATGVDGSGVGRTRCAGNG